MLTEPAQETAISEVVGEMLMIAVVLILLAVFSSSLSSYLPSERSPSVDVKVCNDTNSITLWHKGGDWIKTDSLRVVVTYDRGTTVSYRLNGPGPRFTLGTGEPDSPQASTQTFDLGDTIAVPWNSGCGIITLATDRAVVFSGAIGEACP